MKTSKRIALLGNMNNNLFNLTRYLRDQGCQAHLFIFPSDPHHFQPDADIYSAENLDYVHHLQWGNAFDLVSTSVETIKKDVGNFDFYIACGSGPAYLAKAGIQIDLLVPYGADLYEMPFFRLVRPTKLFHFYIFTRYQQKGIRTSKNLTYADNAAFLEDKVSRIGFTGKRLYSGVPFVYAKQYAPDVISQWYPVSKYYQAFLEIRKEFDLVIFHHSRHCWKNEPDPVSLKDNDKLFKGLAQYRATSRKKVAIVTFEYGSDVKASKALCKELGLEDSVFWFPLMPRKEIMIGMSLSDIVAGEFRNSWFTYGVVFEAMALAKPVMHYRDDKLYEALELYPMIHAKEIPDIARAIEYYTDNKAELVEMGRSARNWLERNIIEKSLDDISKILAS